MRAKRAIDIDDLYHRLARRILVLGVHLTGDRDLAEDVLQETFLAAHRARSAYRGEASPDTWVHRIAINVALRARERRRRDRRRGDASTLAAHRRNGRAAGAESADQADRLERIRRLHAAMDGLSEEHRVVLSLLAMRELPGRLIAEILQIPEGTVHSRAHAARRRLRELMDEADDSERSSSDACSAGWLDPCH